MDDVVTTLREMADAIEQERKVVRDIQAAAVRLLEVMEMQEKREAEAFHLSAEAFRPMWDAAKEQARAALASA